MGGRMVVASAMFENAASTGPRGFLKTGELIK